MSDSVCIFGGTFDPIHIGHLRPALEVAEELDLDQILLMPSAQPPHGKRTVASFEHRLEMARLAVADNPRLGVSDLEGRLGGKSYTINTIGAVKAENPGKEIYFLIGADAFFYLHTWHDPLKLFDMANFVVMARPKSPHTDVLDYLRTTLHSGFYQGQDGWVRLNGGKGVIRVPTTLLSISSTYIRKRAAAGRSLAYLVPPVVEDYITMMKLYEIKGKAA